VEHSVQEKSSSLKFSKFRTRSEVKYSCHLQVHHPRCVFMEMMVGGSVKTQLS